VRWLKSDEGRSYFRSLYAGVPRPPATVVNMCLGRKNRIEVVQVDTGVRFPSLRSAAKSVGCCRAALKRALANGGEYAGYHWAYI
jgi:hypothetical protein